MIIKCHSPYAYLRDRLVFTYIVCFHNIPNFSLVFSVFPSYRVQKFFFFSNCHKSPNHFPIYLKKMCTNGPAQFKPILLKGPLCMYIKSYYYTP